MRARSFSLARCSATPSNSTAPSLGRSSPAQIAISVVLPLPDGPTMAQVQPTSAAVILSLILMGATPTQRVILFLGDSTTAGYGLELEEAYPALIQEKI